MKTSLLILAALITQAADEPKVQTDQPATADKSQPQTPPTMPSYRTWTSHDGKSTTLATFVSFTDGRVILKRLGDGKILKIAPSDLSDGDMVWVRAQLAKRTAKSKYACKRCRDTKVAKCPNHRCRGGQVYGKVPYEVWMESPSGGVYSLNYVDGPIGTCRMCNGLGKIPCPQCLAADYEQQQQERDFDRLTRERDIEQRRANSAEMRRLRDEAAKAKEELERLKRDRAEGRDKAVVKPPNR